MILASTTTFNTLNLTFTHGFPVLTFCMISKYILKSYYELSKLASKVRSVEKMKSSRFVFTVDERNTWACFQLFDISQWTWNERAALTSVCVSKTGINSLQVSFLLHSRRSGSWKVKKIHGLFQSVLFKYFRRECHMFSPQTLLQNSPEIRAKNRGEQSKGLETVSQVLHRWSTKLHRWGGVAHHVVVVRRWAVTL